MGKNNIDFSVTYCISHDIVTFFDEHHVYAE